MDPAVAVVVPYGGDCPHRAANLDWVLGMFAEHAPGWRIVVARAPEGPWCKARAVHAGIAEAGPVDVVVVHDADVWSAGTPLAAALAADGRHRWAMPHRTVRRLGEAPTAAVRDGGKRLAHAFWEAEHAGYRGGGIVALRRGVWDEAPMDPRFVGWGHEDESWARALSTLVGDHGAPKADLPCWHLWHPPAERRSRGVGSVEAFELRNRYIAARLEARHGNEAPMRELADEARELLNDQ